MHDTNNVNNAINFNAQEYINDYLNAVHGIDKLIATLPTAELTTARHNALELFATLPNRYQAIMIRKYLKSQTVPYIADKENYSERQVHRIIKKSKSLLAETVTQQLSETLTPPPN